MTQNSERFIISVENIPPSTNEEKLAEVFSEFGAILHTHIFKKAIREQINTNGLVEFKTQQGYDGALNSENSIIINGVMLHVSPLPPLNQRDTIYLSDLPETVSEESIRAGLYGFNITQIKLKNNCASVKFATFDDFNRAIQLQNIIIDGKQIDISVQCAEEFDYKQFSGNIQNQLSLIIFVRNIPYSTGPEELADAFAKFGDIQQARIVSTTFRDQTTSRGFGFVEFKTKDGYENALNNKEPIKIAGENGERTLIVIPARPPRPIDTIFLVDLPETTTEQSIRKAFNGFNIIQVRFPQPRNAQLTRKYFAFVRFGSVDEYNRAISLQNVTIEGKQVRILSTRRQNRLPFRNRRRGFRGRGRRHYRRNRPDQSTQDANNSTQQW